ncbi:potassium-transporting ATPase subunit KdpA [Neochlamydia sp. EPS4]|uniref:potassium-transporting ATPase subunit KdpA n=1 Tax=Neochlamydia sp. EPS4 TaxID=1478175 RepID=UPI0005D10A58|nr:potassium-transporting ATPase subunit KdpA [Neochlamydia sp. EPS4]
MSYADWATLLFFPALLIVLTPVLGRYMAKIFTGQRTAVHFFLGGLEHLFYRLSSVDAKKEMSWLEYATALLIFNIIGFLGLFFLQLLQHILPLNPQHFPAVPWPLAFNTAISFITNTNWQAYAGETTMSYLTQMLGLAVHNFLSAATGLATLLALIRGLVSKNTKHIGNFWSDLIRSIVYLLLPLSILLALLLVSEGVVQTFSPYIEVTTLENSQQIIPLGPVASQVAIKQLGTNGGGFFNANSAHPFENPSPVTNLFEMLAILLIPAASVYAYGILIDSKKHAWNLFAVMIALWVVGLSISFYAEKLMDLAMDASPFLEGKETRLGTNLSLVWAMSTSATSNGSVNAMLSSLSPLSGGMAMLNMMLGEIVFGGVGVGLCSMIMFAILTVFLAGLMVGRTPVYLGKKIERKEMQWLMLATLMPSFLILIGSGLSCILPEALASLGSQGPHGLSEILYAFSSAAGNNGSAFAGINANTLYYNLFLGIVMLISRSSIILSSLAIAGLLASKRASPHSSGDFSISSPLFAFLLLCVILIVGALTFFPAWSLGPLAEHLLMLKGQTF